MSTIEQQVRAIRIADLAGWNEAERETIALVQKRLDAKIDAIFHKETPSAQPTVQVPVSLIERIAAEYEREGWPLAAQKWRTLLLPQPTPSAEPRMTCGEPRPHDAHEGETGFGDEPDIDWVHWKCPGVSLATQPSIADMAPGTTDETDDQRRIREALRIDADYRRLHASGRANAIVRALTRDVTPPPEPDL